jgi:hypothetical protein
LASVARNAIASELGPPLAQSEWLLIARAIRDYLYHSYANGKLGIATDTVPLRLSTYSGKGLGTFATGDDGRADWTTEFAAYLARSEARTPRASELRFGFAEVDRAMTALESRYPVLWTVLNALDVHGVRIEDFCLETGRHIGTVKRQRKKATFFLYESLRLGSRDDERVEVAIFCVI